MKRRNFLKRLAAGLAIIPVAKAIKPEIADSKPNTSIPEGFRLNKRGRMMAIHPGSCAYFVGDPPKPNSGFSTTYKNMWGEPFPKREE
jgi:hypothetical protein